MKKSMGGIVLLLAGFLAAGFSAQGEEAHSVKTSGDKTAVVKTQNGKTTSLKKAKAVNKPKAVKKAVTAVVEKEVWICPMCRVKSDKPGKCPECGMDMVKWVKEKKE